MPWRHSDFQNFLEIGYVLSNVGDLDLPSNTSSPGAAVDCPEHDVITPNAQTCCSEGLFQFGLMDDERLTQQAQSTGFVQKYEPWSVEIVDMDHQLQLSSPRGRDAIRTFGEPLAAVRIQHERITWR